MSNKTISSWVRQARYRAKKHGIYSDLEIAEVLKVMEEYGNLCAYCGSAATTVDHPFPLKDSAPNVPANILPTCKSCKNVKKNNDLSWMFANEKITKEQYLFIVEQMLKRKHGELVKAHIRKATGVSVEE